MKRDGKSLLNAYNRKIDYEQFWSYYLTTNNIYEQNSNIFPYMFLLYLGGPYILVHYILFLNHNGLLLTSSRVFSIDLLISVKHTVLKLKKKIVV